MTELYDVILQAELDQLGVANREGGEGGEGEGVKVGGGGEGEGKDNSVWEEQLQQELEDMELQASV